ncbi:MAG: FkbM family methyltransferase [Rhodothermales bacterium]|nr:FkbM family methyltransferase [Rhodothermales bacterium]
MTLAALKDLLRYIRLRIRTLVGTDHYSPPEIRLPKTVLGGTPPGRSGSWTVALDRLTSESTVYAVGVGTDITFDLALIGEKAVTVHAFDPTKASIDWLRTQNPVKGFLHHAYGVAAFDGVAKFHANVNPDWVSATMLAESGSPEFEQVEVRRISTLMSMLGHSKLDLLKLDIEGAEYDVIADLVASNVDVRQLLVEFHHRLPSCSLDQTRTALRRLQEAGFRIFDVSANGEEYGLIRD